MWLVNNPLKVVVLILVVVVVLVVVLVVAVRWRGYFKGGGGGGNNKDLPANLLLGKFEPDRRLPASSNIVFKRG